MKLLKVSCLLLSLTLAGAVEAKQVTVEVAPKAITDSGDDGFSFKTTSGKEYSTSSDGSVPQKGLDLIFVKKKSTLCLTLDETDDHVTTVVRGKCK
jgi:hypothetical protein